MFQCKVPLSAAMMAFAVSAVAGAAFAGDADHGARVAMPLGLSAPAPGGFLEFCRRTPTQCMSSSSLSSNRDDQDPARVSRLASQMLWQNVFATNAGRAPASTGSAPQPVARPRQSRSRVSARGRFDWNQAFAVQAARPVFIPTRPQVHLDAGAAFSATDQVRPAVDPDADGISYQATSASEIRYDPALPVRQEAERAVAARPFGPPLARSWTLTQPFSPVAAAHGESESAPVSDLRSPTSIGASTSEVEAAPTVVLSRENWALLNRVNRQVNRQIRQASDQTVFGQSDYWQAPTQDGAYGDCEDYVLAKRQALIEAGVPAAALSIAIVETRWGESHAVLLVAGDTGEVVLDSLSSWISRWDRVDYVWRERQAPGKIFEWVAITA